MRYYETTKLFYNKYLYKLNFSNELNTIFRTEFQKDGRLSLARQKLDELRLFHREGLPMEIPIWRTVKKIREEDYIEARHLYATLLRTKEDYRIRVESWGGITVFANSEELLNKIAKGISNRRRLEFYRPDPNVINEIKPNIIISPNPVEWPIKVTLGCNIRNYSSFAKWAENNPDKVRIGKKALESLHSHGFVDGYYFFVKTEKVLSIINIIIGDNIRRIDHVVYKSNIDK